MPRAENQVANDLAQIPSRYKVPKEKLEDLIEIRGRVLVTKLSHSYLSTMRLGFADSEKL